jgi:hypothetical protein
LADARVGGRVAPFIGRTARTRVARVVTGQVGACFSRFAGRGSAENHEAFIDIGANVIGIFGISLLANAEIGTDVTHFIGRTARTRVARVVTGQVGACFSRFAGRGSAENHEAFIDIGANVVGIFGISLSANAEIGTDVTHFIGCTARTRVARVVTGQVGAFFSRFAGRGSAENHEAFIDIGANVVGIFGISFFANAEIGTDVTHFIGSTVTGTSVALAANHVGTASEQAKQRSSTNCAIL